MQDLTVDNLPVTIKEQFKFEDFLEDLKYLSAENPYLGLISVDSTELGELILKNIERNFDVVVEDPNETILSFRASLEKHTNQKDKILLVPFFRVSPTEASKIARLLIGPRDAITYYNLDIIIIVNTETYKSIYDEAFDLISYANFKFSFHDEEQKQKEIFNFNPNSALEREYLQVMDELEKFDLTKVPDSPLKVLQLNELTEKANIFGRYDEALRFSKDAIRIAKLFKFKDGEVDAKLNNSVTLLDLERIDEAIDCLQDLYKFSTTDRKKDIIKHRLAFAYMYKLKFNESNEIYKELLKKGVLIDKDLYWTTYLNLGNNYQYSGEYFKIKKIINEVELNISQLNKNNIAISLNKIANYYSEIGNIKKAYLMYINSIENLFTNSSKSDSINNIGIIYNYNGNLQISNTYFKKSLSLSKYTSRNKTNTNNLGFNDFAKGNFELALKSFGISYRESLRMGNLITVLSSITGIIECQIELNNLHEAKKNLNKYYQTINKKDFPKYNNEYLFLKSNILLKENQPQTALTELAKAKEILIKSGNFYGAYIENFNLSAKCHLKLGNYEAAHNDLQEAKERLKTVEGIWREMENKELWGEYYESQQNYPLSRRSYFEAHRFWKRIGNEQKTKRLAEKMNRVEEMMKSQ